MGETGGGRGRIRVHSRGGSNSVRGEGEQKRGEAGRQEDVGGTLLGEWLFLFFWREPVECTPHHYSVFINKKEKKQKGRIRLK